MEPSAKARYLKQIEDTLGVEGFNRLVISVRELRSYSKLAFWQEQMLSKAGVDITTAEQFIEFFGNTKQINTGRPSEPITAAVKTYLEPLLKSHGFKKYKQRNFARVVNDIVFQSIGLELCHYGDRSFRVFYTTFLITEETEHIGSTTFNYLRHAKGVVGSWPGHSQKHADQSMQEVRDIVTTFAIPWFEKTVTPLGLADELFKLLDARHVHAPFDLALCYIAANDLSIAKMYLQAAIKQYQKTHDEMPIKTWALDLKAKSQLLLDAVESGTHQALLAQWKTRTIKNLKLEKLI